MFRLSEHVKRGTLPHCPRTDRWGAFFHQQHMPKADYTFYLPVASACTVPRVCRIVPLVARLALGEKIP